MTVLSTALLVSDPPPRKIKARPRPSNSSASILLRLHVGLMVTSWPGSIAATCSSPESPDSNKYSSLEYTDGFPTLAPTICEEFTQNQHVESMESDIGDISRNR
ncbi:hypothetical protein TWF569_011988 [Orbilia oligospora]|nr:hypothetical protein TWF706_011993 [Orbilia oligospora]KAF3084165.1 hypothetical protein TWF103_011998 [Orbilia oligospora]KAF3127230.1 hypothetical protein TWF569_011988 [Orbilia oligospora]